MCLGVGEDTYMRWNSAPTLVERQRENLTERLRREFGLFLSDDEEQERARKQGGLT
jgi:histone-lysine N-methyltransferase MLL5